MSINKKDLLSEFNENIKFDYNLKKRNWFNIGGNAKIFYKAENLKELIKFLKIIKNKEKIFILGGGSNPPKLLSIANSESDLSLTALPAIIMSSDRREILLKLFDNLITTPS